MERFDEKYLIRKSEMEPLKMLPSEYIKDHRCYFTCEGEESALPLVIEQFGDRVHDVRFGLSALGYGMAAQRQPSGQAAKTSRIRPNKKSSPATPSAFYRF